MKPLVLGLLLCVASVPALAMDREQVRMLRQLNEREALQDSLEAYFDKQLCAPLKRGRFLWPKEVAAPGVHLPVEDFVSVENCSVRALGFEPRAKDASVRLLFELDGIGRDGARRTVRGEYPATFRRLPRSAWRLEHLDTSRAPTVTVRTEPRFREWTEAAGLSLPDESKRDHSNMQNGSLAVRDFDGDGLPDILVANPSGLFLFHATAPLRYERSELALRPPAHTWFSSLAAGDFDADGDADVLVFFQTEELQGATPVLLRNDGGTFTAVPSSLPRVNGHASVVSDLDGDGHLDVVLLYYSLSRPPDDQLDASDGRPPRFFLGQGDLSFREVAPPKAQRYGRWGLAAVAADLLGQGRPQVYVANDFGDNDLWSLEADGSPRDVTEAHDLRDPGNGMSADVGDLDGDGRLDLYVANMFSKAGTRVLAAARVTSPGLEARLDKFAAGNTLYLARDGGHFEEVALARNVNRGLWAWGSIFLDADDDGRLDLAVANGFYSAPNRKDL
ncbi:FG-GAP-like repeat-containing protein [Archangium sp.]|uniref:FG-GAP-like repeat-containing protein n=1 Tax=Archangium sp. TaxID=1872627 RepID=UPI00389A03E7